MTLKQNIKFIASAIIAFILIAALTVVALKFLAPADTPESTSEKTAVELKETPEASAVINEYREKDDIGDRATAYTELKTPEVQPSSAAAVNTDQASTLQAPTNSLISYAAIDKYTIQIAASNYAQYSHNDTSASENTEATKKATEAFLLQKEFTKTSTDTTTKGVILTNFEGTNTLCQISDFSTAVFGSARYGLACVAKSSVTEQYERFNNLFALPGTPYEVQNLTRVVESMRGSKDTMSLTVLLVTDKNDKASQLIYASIDSDWSYIGQRPVPNPDDAASFTMPEELQTAIKDPKWNGFLQENIK